MVDDSDSDVILADLWTANSELEEEEEVIQPAPRVVALKVPQIVIPRIISPPKKQLVKKRVSKRQKTTRTNTK